MELLGEIITRVSQSVASTVQASFWGACFVGFIAVLICRVDIRRGISVFLCYGYTYMVIFRTLIHRRRWEEPLEKVMGGWGLYTDKGGLTTEAIENFMLLIPFALFLGLLCGSQWRDLASRKVLRRLTLSAFFLSLGIETVQILGNRGTFQFSDLCYNTLGGLAGGVIFVVVRRMYNHNKHNRD